KAANASINPGYEIEIVVEAISPGSVKAVLTGIYTQGRNLFSKQTAAAVILSVIANYIYDRTLSLDESVRVNVTTDEVIIEKGEERIVVPREVHEAKKEAERNPKFVEAVDT